MSYVGKIDEFRSKYYVFDPFLLVYLADSCSLTCVDLLIDYVECRIKFWHQMVTASDGLT